MMRLKTRKQYLLMLLMALLALPSWGQTTSGDKFTAGDFRCEIVDFNSTPKTAKIISVVSTMPETITVPTELTYGTATFKISRVDGLAPENIGAGIGDCSQVKHVVFPEGITFVAGGAVANGNFPELLDVSFPATITFVGDYIGAGEGKLVKFLIGGSADSDRSNNYFTVDGVLYMNNSDGGYTLVSYPSARVGEEDSESNHYGDNAYKEITYGADDDAVLHDKYQVGEIKEVSLKEGEQIVPGQKYRVIPGTTQIDGNAFYRVTSYISNIEIPTTVKTLDPLIHTRLVMWSMYDPTTNQRVYESEFFKIGQSTGQNGLYDYGVLYQKLGDGKLRLQNYPKLYNINGHYEMPANVISISGNSLAFGNLKSISFAEGITELSGNLFRFCHYMAEVKIPSTVVSLGSNLFWESHGVRRIIVDTNNDVYENRHVRTSINPVQGLQGNEVWKDWVVYTKADADGNRTMVLYPSSYVGNEIINEDGTDKNTYVFDANTTAIGDNVFKEAAFQALRLPDELETIGSSAFFNCSNLTEYDFVTAGGTNSSLKEIGSSAFARCANLEKAVIPSGVTKIGSEAYRYDNKLTELVFDSKNATGLQEIGNFAFDGCSSMERELDLSVCGQLDKIGERCFNNVPLTEVILPESVTNIGKSAFSKDDDVVNSQGTPVTNVMTSFKVHYGSELAEIGENAFQNNKNCNFASPRDDKGFEGLFDDNGNMKSSITKIGNRAFYGCEQISGPVKISADVTALGSQAFTLCPLMTEFDVNSQNPYYCDIDGMLLTKNLKKMLAFPGGKKKTEFDFQNGKNFVMIPPVEEMGDSIFFGVNGVTNIKVPATVKKVGLTTFDRSANLRSLSLMGEYAFNCDLHLYDESKSTSANTNSTLFVRKNVQDKYQSWVDNTNSNKFTQIKTSFETKLPSGYEESQYAAPEYFPWHEDEKSAIDEVAFVGFDSKNPTLETMTTVIIPAKIKDDLNGTEYDVHMIGENAFENTKALTSATLFCTPRYIGSGAFTAKKGEGYNNLRDLYLVNPTKTTDFDGKDPIATSQRNLGTRYNVGDYAFLDIYDTNHLMYVKKSVNDHISDYWLTQANAPRVDYQIKKVVPNKVTSRTYSATTFCREFPVKFSDDVEVYRIEAGSEYERNNDESNTVDKGTGITGYLKAFKVDNRHGVPAGQAVLVVNKTGETALPDAYYQMVDDNDVDAIAKNGMVGAYGDVTMVKTGGVATGYKELPINSNGTQKTSVASHDGQKVYALSKRKGWFAQVSADYIPAYKGFFMAAGNTNLSKGFMMFDLDGEIATAIDRALQAEDADATWYNVDGSKLEGRPSVKGVYIRNGKKFVVK